MIRTTAHLQRDWLVLWCAYVRRGDPRGLMETLGLAYGFTPAQACARALRKAARNEARRAATATALDQFAEDARALLG